MATPTPDYNQLVANLLTKRDQLKSALRETEAELEEIEDFLDALDRFYDQAQDQFRFTKALPHHVAQARNCKFYHPCADGIECENPKISNFMCDLFHADDKTTCGGWEAKDND